MRKWFVLSFCTVIVSVIGLYTIQIFGDSSTLETTTSVIDTTNSTSLYQYTDKRINLLHKLLFARPKILFR